VQVCPTGIDIRDGLQYECIGCGACADVCDTVMDKLGYAKGLVRYSTQNAMDNKWTPKQIWQRIMRPRIQIYTMILVAVTLGLLVSLGLRTPFKVDVVRDRSTLSRITEQGTLENIYRMQIMNAAETTRAFHLSVKGLPGLKITTETDVTVDAAQARWVVLSAEIPYGSTVSGSHKIEFEIQAVGSDDVVLEKSVFIVPR
jgi:cytochrome c oxidase accessory protein FixG